MTKNRNNIEWERGGYPVYTEQTTKPDTDRQKFHKSIILHNKRFGGFRGRQRLKKLKTYSRKKRLDNKIADRKTRKQALLKIADFLVLVLHWRIFRWMRSEWLFDSCEWLTESDCYGMEVSTIKNQHFFTQNPTETTDFGLCIQKINK